MNNKIKNDTIPKSEFSLSKHWLWIPVFILLLINVVMLLQRLTPANPFHNRFVIYPLLIYGSRYFGIVNLILIIVTFIFASSKTVFGLEHNRRSKFIAVGFFILIMPAACYNLITYTVEIRTNPLDKLKTSNEVYNLIFYRPEDCTRSLCSRYLLYQCDGSNLLCTFVHDYGSIEEIARLNLPNSSVDSGEYMIEAVEDGIVLSHVNDILGIYQFPNE